MTEYVLVSDAGPDGLTTLGLHKVYYDEDYIKHFDVRIFSKELYEYYKQPRKLNSYLYHRTTSAKIDLGITVIVATELPTYVWYICDYSYNLFGVPGIAMPIGAIDAKIFHKGY